MRDTTKETPSLTKVIEDAIRSKLLDLRVSLPGEVVVYDASQQKARIKPLLKKEYHDGEIVDIPEIPGVPVQWPSAGGGNSYIHLPLKKGDFGLLIFADRNIDVWLSKAGNTELPGDTRIHDLSDAIFLPGIRPFGNALPNISPDNLTIKNDQLTIELHPSGKISISGASADLLPVLKNIFSTVIGDTLIVSGVTTGGGIASAVFSPATIASVNTDINKLDTLIP